MNLTALLIPSFQQMLRSLLGLLDKASANRTGDAADALLAAQLAPDMFPLSAQLRFSALQAVEAITRIRGEAAPSGLADLGARARASIEVPGTLDEARGVIREVLAFLDGLGPDALDAAADRAVTVELQNGMAFDMTGDQYARDWALPQFYFHVSMAYAILRSQGVELGKADYVPHMLAYIRGVPKQA